jgi:prolyl 4-hydroxylase
MNLIENPIQVITPDILKWIATQAQAGHKPDAVLAAMRTSGWSEEVALRAIEQARYGTPYDQPNPVPVPDPDVSDTHCVLRTTDREVQVVASLKWPRVLVFGNLLSHQECDELMELARDRLDRSLTVDNWSGGNELSEWRSSDGMCFQRGENEVARRVEARLAELVNWPLEKGEGLQVLRYGPGAQYRPHHDYFDPTVPGTPAILERGGQRIATVLMYLQAPLSGGATIFPETGFQVTPAKGGAVFFSYDRAHQVSRTLHGGAPVIEGEKWIATKWLREKVHE